MVCCASLFSAAVGVGTIAPEGRQEAQEAQPDKTATESREVLGVRGQCFATNRQQNLRISGARGRRRHNPVNLVNPV